ncbi:MAG: SMI1/KNR4 family protein [Rhodobacterales bacterium]|nr:SMI1/KNR4 family protein [Rhodobacterales bacterium]
MNSSSVTEATQTAIREIWRVLGPRGSVEGAFNAFRAGHMPEKGPYWYSASVFNGLSDEEIDELEDQLPYPHPEQTRARIPQPMRDFLAVTNGLNLHSLSISGQQGRIDHGAGAPFSLATNQLERAPGVSKTWFGIGAMNGPWRSQGSIFLTDKDEVTLMHRDSGDIGARWPNLGDFLAQEIPRLLRIHDEKGDPLPGESLLPGDTARWEEIAERAYRVRFGWRGKLRRTIDRLRGD